MFERITDEEERGQVGIGTLIVFIAMVLVAAIAAGVLINTAGLLQSQAQATGEESTAQVSNVVQIDSATGNVSEPDDPSLDGIDIVFEDQTTGEDISEIDGFSIDLAEGDDTDTLSDESPEFVDVTLDGDETITVSDGDNEATYDADASDVEDGVLTFDIEGEVGGTQDADGGSIDGVDLVTTSEASTDYEVRQASMMVSLGPGSDPVDLSAATFEYVNSHTERGTAKELDDLDIAELDGDQRVLGEGNDFNAILESDNHLEIIIDLDGENDQFSPIESGGSAEFLITTADGAQTVELLMAPSTLTKESAVTL